MPGGAFVLQPVGDVLRASLKRAGADEGVVAQVGQGVGGGGVGHGECADVVVDPVQRGDALLLVDQHAAHERLLFERYRAQFYAGTPPGERFLLPVLLELSAQNALLLEQYLPQFNKLGFAVEAFGRNGFLVRQVPALLAGKGVRCVTFADWKRLDELEVKRGQPAGKPRAPPAAAAPAVAGLASAARQGRVPANPGRPPHPAPAPARAAAVQERILERIRALPGVASAGATTCRR